MSNDLLPHSCEMLLTIKNGEPIKGHTEPCGDHCIFWQCTVENPFSLHMKSVLPKQTAHAILLWLVDLLLALFSAWETARVRISTHHHTMQDRWWCVECGQGTHFSLYSSPTAANYGGQLCTNHLHTSNCLDSHHLPCLLAFVQSNHLHFLHACLWYLPTYAGRLSTQRK